jgi:hypothetical protein
MFCQQFYGSVITIYAADRQEHAASSVICSLVAHEPDS